MKKLFIDIGGSYLRSEFVSNEGVVTDTLRSSEIGLLSYIDSVVSHHPSIDFIGISYAGQVEMGTIIAAPNIHIDCYEIAETVESRYGIPLKIDNDLNCAIRAEAAHWNTQSIAALSVGTGIGAAVIDQGHLVRGSHNMAFEIGHIPYRESPFVCGCGRNNCIELYASGSGLSKWLDHEGIGGEVDLECFKSSLSPQKERIAHSFEEALITATGVVVTLANPEILVLGGGVIHKNPYLLKFIRDNLKKYTLSSAYDTLRIELSVLENPSLAGAKLLESENG